MKIIMVSDSPDTPSGFGSHMRFLSKYLGKEHEVLFFGLQCFKRSTMNIDGVEITMLPKMANEMFGERTLKDHIAREKPDIVISHLDIQQIRHLTNVRKPSLSFIKLRDEEGDVVPFETGVDRLKQAYELLKEQHEFKWVAILPIDGDPVPPEWYNVLRIMDYPVAMSKYGKKTLETQFPDLDVSYIHHGIDTDLFKPMKVEKNVFVVGNINRNQHRKRIPETMEGFARFAKNKKDARLLLHMDWKDPMGWDIMYLANYYRITEKLLQPTMNSFYDGVELDELVKLYNTCDVYLNTMGGEGFGLTVAEALSCGVPACCTDYTTTRELIKEEPYAPRGSSIKVDHHYWDTADRAATPRAYVKSKDVASVLEKYYKMPRLVKQHGANGRKFAVKKLDWERVISKEWIKLVDSI